MVYLLIKALLANASLAPVSWFHASITPYFFVGEALEWLVSNTWAQLYVMGAIMVDNETLDFSEAIIYFVILILAVAIWILILLHKKLIKRSNEVKFKSEILESANKLLEELLEERKRGEDALRESEQTFRTLFEQSTDSLALLDNGKFADCNHAMMKLLGYSDKSNIIGHTPWELSPPFQFNGVSSEDKAKEIIAETLEKGNSRFEWIHVKADGTEFPTEVVLTLFKFKGKNLMHVSLRDISVRKKIEQALRESEENYRMLVENQTDMVVKVDAHGNFLFVSPSYCKFFGKHANELLGKNFIPLVHPDDVESTKKEMGKLYSPPYFCKIQQRALTPQGWRWVSWTDTAVLNESGQVTAIIGVGRDITERKKAEQQWIESKMSLEGSLAEKSAHLQAMSHEIEVFGNTVSSYFDALLTSIRDISMMGEDNSRTDQEQVAGKVQSVIQEYSIKLGSLINNFQKFSHTWRNLK